MHEHQFSAGAIRGQQTFRYCIVEGCTKALFYYATNRKPEERTNDDVQYYRKMAEFYGIE